MKKTLKHFLKSVFAIVSGIGVSYAGFIFPSTGETSGISEIDMSIADWDNWKENTIISLAASMNLSFAVSSRGGVYAWGVNDLGELGGSPANITASFTGLATDEKVISVVGNTDHFLALTSRGKVFSWGSDSAGQLGNGTVTGTVTSPTNITANFIGLATDEKIISIDAGQRRSLALTSRGKVFSWGWGVYGALGTGGTDNKTSPTNITSKFGGLLTDEIVTSISMSNNSCSALTSLGKVFTWGSGSSGQIGNGNTRDSTSPLNITAYFTGLEIDEKVIYHAQSGNQAYALTSLGKVFVWGSDSWGSQGNGATTGNVTSPANITTNFDGLETDERVILATGGVSMSVFLTSSGKVFTCGSNNSGQIGKGTVGGENIDIPLNVTANFSGLDTDEKVIFVTGGGVSHILALTSLGKVFAWGRGGYGAIGDGTNEDAPSPINITANFHL